MNAEFREAVEKAEREGAFLRSLVVKPERNADGDTLEDMKAVQKLLGYRAIQADYNHQGFVPKSGEFWHMDATRYRITAKHADRFDAECMDFETWARAAIGRGMLLRMHDGERTVYCHDVEERGVVTKITMWRFCNCFVSGVTQWTAITRAQYEQETKPKEPRELIKNPLQEIQSRFGPMVSGLLQEAYDLGRADGRLEGQEATDACGTEAEW